MTSIFANARCDFVSRRSIARPSSAACERHLGRTAEVGSDGGGPAYCAGWEVSSSRWAGICSGPSPPQTPTPREPEPQKLRGHREPTMCATDLLAMA